MPQYLLAIDQGTTSTRAMVFTSNGQCVGQHQQEFPQYFPQDGWVEHNPQDILNSVLETCRTAINKAQLKASDQCAIGISNQRETTIIWDRSTGRPIYNAIVWQDRRTAAQCQTLKSAEALVRAKTGLLLDPYFSATKIAWILEHVTGARTRAERGELAFGTVDSYLIWCLTGGARHVTDATNAARTLLFNIHTQCWDEELLALFDIPAALLPAVLDNCADFGGVSAPILGVAATITGVAGDQQAALIGQACFQPGMIKTTYGTGCFMVLNTGTHCVQSSHQLIATVAYRLQQIPTYALEGSIFVAGAAVQWLRDAMKLIVHANDTEQLASSVASNGGVYLVPAFTGLGAPYWDPQARGAILGLTRDTSIAHITRAALEAVCYQSRDLLLAMMKDSAITPISIRVDGGMVVNNWLLQFLADMLDIDVIRPAVIETSALGVAYLAGLTVGVFKSLDDIATRWQQERVFVPSMAPDQRERLYAGWVEAVAKVQFGSTCTTVTHQS